MEIVKKIIVLISALLVIFLISSCTKKDESPTEPPTEPPIESPVEVSILNQIVDSVIEKSILKLKHSVEEIKNRAMYPTYGTKELKWQIKSSKDWTSGFYPGTLWYAYELSNDTIIKKYAIEWTAGIENQKYNKLTHDLGFRFNCSFGNGLRLASEDIATKKYKEILLTAAATADSRFSSLIGQYPSSWDKYPLPNSIPTVVDVMMNLELLMWASENGGNPAIKERCITHANTSYDVFVRKDGGTFHVVRYDKTTGIILAKGQLQGDVDSSTWSRGQAWMVYGFTVMYRYTKNPKYLENAKNLANYFIKNLPVDKVANWDFQSTLDHRDASASAIVSSALFELQNYITDENEKKYYLTQAEEILKSLCQSSYFAVDKATNCLLLKSTQYFYDTNNTDVPSTFADYYFLESILRYKHLKQ